MINLYECAGNGLSRCLGCGTQIGSHDKDCPVHMATIYPENLASLVISLRAELAELKAHDRTKCPNCENCITDLRRDNKRLETESARKDELIEALDGVVSAYVELEDAIDKYGINALKDTQCWRFIFEARARLAEIRKEVPE